ncbi:MAG TPA: Holliday junction branch migration protein RuvA [Gammaproteobacteria bacterium]|nr:Holliday junction branch migration protein RuvA [Gammaproteobacteria bacterium]
MIGWIDGTLKEKHPPYLLVDVNGVGYELEAPMTTFYTLPALGDAVKLYTHQVVREDAHPLYGFSLRRDRYVFRMLLRVSGVGARIGLAILSGMDANAFSRCVFENDTQSLSRLPGIGKKTAERLVIEMRDRLDRADGGVAAAVPGVAPLPPAADPVSEAVSALVSLGFKPQEASQRVRAVTSEGLVCEEIVRLALQSLVK